MYISHISIIYIVIVNTYYTYVYTFIIATCIIHTNTRKVNFYPKLFFLIPAELLNKQMNEVLDQAAKDNLIYLNESIPKHVLERI
jgi:hypothetical protein